MADSRYPNTIKKKKKTQHSKSAKKMKNKQRSKSKRKSVPIVLNDDSDGEIEDAALNSNPIIVPLVINNNNNNNDDILSPNELEQMLNGFDYDFMSQQTQQTNPIIPIRIPPHTTHTKRKKRRLSQTPPPIVTPLITTPAPTFVKPIAKTTIANRSKLKLRNRDRNVNMNQNRKRNKKRKFKPPRLLAQSRSVPPKKNKTKNTNTASKPFKIPKMCNLSSAQRPTKKTSKKTADFDAFLQSHFATNVSSHHKDRDMISKKRPTAPATAGFMKANAKERGFVKANTKDTEKEKEKEKEKEDMDLNEKPPETNGFSTASRSNRNRNRNKNQNHMKPKMRMRCKIRKPQFDKAKLDRFMDPIPVKSDDANKANETVEACADDAIESDDAMSLSKSEEDAEEPYAAFINAIPDFNESQMFEDDEETMENCREPLHSVNMNHSEPTPQQLDSMTPAEYIKYKEKLKLSPTRSITSANTLQYRVIPAVKPNLFASKSATSRVKLANFNALLDELRPGQKQKPKQKHKHIQNNITPITRQRAAQRNRMAKLDGSTRWWTKLQSREQEKSDRTRKLQTNRIYISQVAIDTAATWSRKRKMDFDDRLRWNQPTKKRKLTNTPFPKQVRNPYRDSRQTVPKHMCTAADFTIPNFSALPTMKDVVDKSCNGLQLPIFSDTELSTQFGLCSDIIHMSLIRAQDYTFKEKHTATALPLPQPLILNEDDACGAFIIEDDACDELVNDDWNNMESDEAFTHHIRNAISHLNASNSGRGNGNGNGYGYEDAYTNLLQLGCDSTLLRKKWVQHHWSMIVWSLACRVRSVPFKLNASSYFSYWNVFQHLKYRYEYEINGGNASTLHKIYRGDLSAACYVILAVSRVVYANHNNELKSNRLWLTDGWYEIEATFLDSDIESLVECGDIKLGDKLKICLARKEGAHCEPLESKAVQVSMQIARNYVRKAAWYKKLGHVKVVPNVFRVSLRSIRCNGGCVPYIYCCVTRKYSNQYSIKRGDDRKGKIYTLKAKERLDAQYETERYSKTMELRLTIAKEMGLDRYQDQSEENIDIDRNTLEKKIDEWRERVESQVSNLVSLNRKVSEFFSCKIQEVGSTGMLLDSYSTEITVWNRNENVSQCMKHGNYVKIYNVNTQNRVNAQSNMVQLSAGTRTRFEVVNVEQMGYKKETIQRNYDRYIATRYCEFNSDDANMNTVEFDMIGCIVKVMRDRLFIIGLAQNNANKVPLISLEVKQSEYIVLYRSMKPNSVYIIKNIKYGGYDQNLSLHCAFAYARTEFISNALRDVQFKAAKQFTKTEDAQRQIQSMLHTIDTKILHLSAL